MTDTQNPSLIGLEEICAYARRSEATVRKMIQENGFPAAKIHGTWESDKTLIDQWKQRLITAVACAATRKPAAGQESKAPNPYTKGRQVFGPSSGKIDRGW